MTTVVLYQVTTDIPQHSHLRGQKCNTLDRTYDGGTRGLGGSTTNPVASCGQWLLPHLSFSCHLRPILFASCLSICALQQC